MALPAWPIPTFRPQQSGTSPLQRMRDPLATEMEGGNLRQRSRPGDNVGTIQQTIQMPLAETFFATSFGIVADKFGVAWMLYVPA